MTENKLPAKPYPLGAHCENGGIRFSFVSGKEDCGVMIYDRITGKAIADVITLHDETIDDSKPYEIFDPEHVWKRKNIENFVAKPLHQQIFENGQCVYNSPTVSEIRDYCREQLNTLWDEVLRFENPHKYYVDLSQALWDEKHKLLAQHGNGNKAKK